MSRQLTLDERKLFVRGLAADNNEDNIKKIFSPFGKITEVFIPRNHETQHSRGYAFVTFENLSDCREACRMIDGQKFHGKLLYVEAAIARGFRRDSRHHFGDRRQLERFDSRREGRNAHLSEHWPRRSPSPRKVSRRERSYKERPSPRDYYNRSYYEEGLLRYNQGQSTDHHDLVNDYLSFRPGFEISCNRNYGESRIQRAPWYPPTQEVERYPLRDEGRCHCYHCEYSRQLQEYGQHNLFLPEHFGFSVGNYYSDYDARLVSNYDQNKHDIKRRSTSSLSSVRSRHQTKEYIRRSPRQKSPDSVHAHRSDRGRASRSERKRKAARRRSSSSRSRQK